MKAARSVVVAVALGGVGCGDAVRAPITIVVDTDRVRVREEQGRLQELRAGVQGDRAVLDAARVELQRARQRLDEAARGPQRDLLQREVADLEARLGARGPDAITRADLDAALQASEQRVIAAIAAGGGASGRPSPPPAPGTDEAARVRQRLADARTILANKGIAMADLPTGTADLERITALLDRGEAAPAANLAEALHRAATAVVVDKPLLLRRYTRLNERAKQLDPGDERQARVKARLQAAMTALSAGDLATATGALDQLAQDLGT